MRRKSKEKKTTTGTMSKDTLRMIRVIAAHRGIAKHEALDKFGGPGIQAEYRKIMNAESRQLLQA